MAKRTSSPLESTRAKSSRTATSASPAASEEKAEEEAKVLIEALDRAEQEAEKATTGPQVGVVPSKSASAPGHPGQSSNTTAGTPAITATYEEDADLLRMERQTMDASWFARLESEMSKPYFANLKRFLAKEHEAGKTIYPPPALVHSWSRCTPLESVKVVVIGQDPYHGPGQACGHSFSVPRNVPVPGSLKNIYKQLQTEYSDFKPPKHGDLTSWATQGVLLLNACLTVQGGQAGSHHSKGWEPFTRTILQTIAAEAARGGDVVKKKAAANFFAPASTKSKASSNNAVASTSKTDDAGAAPKAPAKVGLSRGVVFLVWGKPAAKMVADAGITSKTPNIHLLHSAHPSPLSAHRGFLGNGHFRATNAFLEAPERYGPGGGIRWGDL